MSGDGSATDRRLADAVTKHYRREVRSIARIARGMGTANWLVRTDAADYFLKEYAPGADLAGEAAALAVSQAARAAGVPAPLVIPSVTGELLWSKGDLALALFEYLPDTTLGPRSLELGNGAGRPHAGSAAQLAAGPAGSPGHRRRMARSRRAPEAGRLPALSPNHRASRRPGRVRPPDRAPPAPAARAVAESRRPPRVAASPGATGGARRLQHMERPLSPRRAGGGRGLSPAGAVPARPSRSAGPRWLPRR